MGGLGCGFLILLLVIIVLLILFILATALGYGALSVVMTPVLCVLLLIGMITGLVFAIKNAVKAFKEIRAKKH